MGWGGQGMVWDVRRDAGGEARSHRPQRMVLVRSAKIGVGV